MVDSPVSGRRRVQPHEDETVFLAVLETSVGMPGPVALHVLKGVKQPWKSWETVGRKVGATVRKLYSIEGSLQPCSFLHRNASIERWRKEQGVAASTVNHTPLALCAPGLR